MNKLRKHGVYYDSRIKLLLILLTSALAFALGGGLTGLLLFGVVCLFALLSGLWKTSIKFAIVYIVLLVLAQVLPIHLSSVITFFLLRILTIALALNILFQTTEISELIAALQASHIPQAIVIPVAIILRFLPSLKQDVLYIKQGMKTRGVGLSFWRIVSHPAQTYEGFLIPAFPIHSYSIIHLRIFLFQICSEQNSSNIYKQNHKYQIKRKIFSYQISQYCYK